MSTLRYWQHYCRQAGLSKEVSKQIIAACEKAGSYSDIDARIKRARVSNDVSNLDGHIPDRERRSYRDHEYD